MSVPNPMHADVRATEDTAQWDAADLTKRNLLYALSEAGRSELKRYLDDRAAAEVSDLDPEPSEFPHAAQDIERLRPRLDRGPGLVILRPVDRSPSLSTTRGAAWIIANILGRPKQQNVDGARVIHIYDRGGGRRMEHGARYHQTRQGGSIHTDNVNIPERWHYLVMACLRPAAIGGDSIFVCGRSVYDVLLHRAPAALEILMGDFWWEKRGFADAFFRQPIVALGDDGEPQFRYLRDYLESAHRRTGEPLSDRQIWALDTLDAALESAELQLRCRLEAGEIVLLNDSRILHGRTPFSDPFAADAETDESEDPATAPPRRMLDRLWVERRQG